MIDADDGMTDIVAAGYDVGIRFHASVHRDMIAVRIGPELRSAIVAAPGYLKGRATPTAPRDLAEHRCVVHRRLDGSDYPWPLRQNGRIRQVRPNGAIAFNDSDLVLAAAVACKGIACVFEDRAAPLVEAGKLSAFSTTGALPPGPATRFTIPTAICRRRCRASWTP